MWASTSLSSFSAMICSTSLGMMVGRPLRVSTVVRPFFSLDKVPKEMPVARLIWPKDIPFLIIAMALERRSRERAFASSGSMVQLPAR
jgi:hypothetical protein